MTASPARSIPGRLAELGLTLPRPVAPVANYVPYKLAGRLLCLSGMIPLLDGQPLATGRLGAEVSVDQGRDCARQCVLNALAWAQEVALTPRSMEEIGKWNLKVFGQTHVAQVLQLRVLVACTPD